MKIHVPRCTVLNCIFSFFAILLAVQLLKLNNLKVQRIQVTPGIVWLKMIPKFHDVRAICIF